MGNWGKMDFRPLAAIGRWAVFSVLMALIWAIPHTLHAGSTPPDPVTSISGLPGSDLGRLQLTWTSTGDDGISGNLVSPSSYTIQE